MKLLSARRSWFLLIVVVVLVALVGGTVYYDAHDRTRVVYTGAPPNVNPMVPETVDMTYGAAKALLVSKGFDVQAPVQGGFVVDQLPIGGSHEPRGFLVTLQTVSGKPSPAVTPVTESPYAAPTPTTSPRTSTTRPTTPATSLAPATTSPAVSTPPPTETSVPSQSPVSGVVPPTTAPFITTPPADILDQKLPAGVTATAGNVSPSAPQSQTSTTVDLKVNAANHWISSIDVYVGYASTAPTDIPVRLSFYDMQGDIIATAPYGPMAGCGNAQHVRVSFSQPIRANDLFSVGWEESETGGLWTPGQGVAVPFYGSDTPLSLTITGSSAHGGAALSGEQLVPSISLGGPSAC